MGAEAGAEKEKISGPGEPRISAKLKIICQKLDRQKVQDSVSRGSRTSTDTLLTEPVLFFISLA
jgi:hypothetical protein